MLAKFVFPKLGYPGWVGLSEKELTEKCEPFKYEVREHWKRLKRSSESMESTLKPYVKTKWCDTAYFLAQVGSWCVMSADGLVRAQRSSRLICLLVRHGRITACRTRLSRG